MLDFVSREAVEGEEWGAWLTAHARIALHGNEFERTWEFNGAAIN